MSNFSTLDLVDRERLSRRLMTLVGKHYEVHQRGQKRFQLVVLLLAEARIEQGFDAADDAGSRQAVWERRSGSSSRASESRQRAKSSSSSTRRLTAAALAARASTTIVRAVSGSRLAKPSSASSPSGPDRARSSPPSRAAAVDRCAQALGAGVEGGEEAVFFVGEMLVEGGAGDAGPVDHVLDVGFQVAEFGRGIQHRYDQALPLDCADQVRGEFAHSGGEFAAAVGKQLERRLDLLGRPIVTDRSEEGLLAQLDSIEGHRETHKFPLKTMQVFSRYQNIGTVRGPLDTAAILRDAPSDGGRPMSSMRPELPREFVASHKRRRMMDAIAELTAEQGYEATKIADIVRRAAVARKTLYDNFDGKEDLFLSAIDSTIEGNAGGASKRLARRPTATGRTGSSPGSRHCSTTSPSTRRRRGCAWSRRYPPLPARPGSTTPACVNSSSCCARALPTEPSCPATIEESLVGGVAWILQLQIRRGEAERAAGAAPRTVPIRPFSVPRCRKGGRTPGGESDSTVADSNDAEWIDYHGDAMAFRPSS